MRAKVSTWARGLAAVVAVGAAVVLLGAGTASASAARAPQGAHVAAGVTTAVVAADEAGWL
jgi:hypothetical protein